MSWAHFRRCGKTWRDRCHSSMVGTRDRAVSATPTRSDGRALLVRNVQSRGLQRM